MMLRSSIGMKSDRFCSLPPVLRVAVRSWDGGWCWCLLALALALSLVVGTYLEVLTYNS